MHRELKGAHDSEGDRSPFDVAGMCGAVTKVRKVGLVLEFSLKHV